MITVTDVIKAVSGLCEDLFGAPPVTKDLREGFQRPCCYLTPTDIRRERMGGLRRETVELELVRFAEQTHKGWLSLMQAQAALGEVLETPIPVAEAFHLAAEDVDFDAVREDMALYCTFTVEYVQQLPASVTEDPEGSADLMKSLQLNDYLFEESEE